MSNSGNSISVWLGTGSSLPNITICQGGGKLRDGRREKKAAAFLCFGRHQVAGCR
jgi:hypothetical protein